jgi:hypothetical protein
MAPLPIKGMATLPPPVSSQEDFAMRAIEELLIVKMLLDSIAR